MIFVQNHGRAILRAIFLNFFIYFSFFLTAQIEVSTDRNTASYEIGETAFFEISATQDGLATYVFRYDNYSPVISSGSINVSSDFAVIIPYFGNEAEVIICEVTFGEVTKTAAAAFSYNEILPLSEEPADFDAFWNNQIELVRDIDLDSQISYLSEDEDVTNYRLNIATLDNRRMYGYISIPKVGTNFPAVVSLPPFSEEANTISPEEFIANRAKCIAVSVSIHNTEPDEADPDAYHPNDISDREGYYYRYAILGTIQIIDYLYTRSDFDGENVSLVGVSQGAGLAMSVAGLDDRVKTLSVSNPALARNAGYEFDRASGFPYFVRKSEELFDTPQHLELTKEASKYYDAVFFASRYDGPTLINVSYEDLVTPAATSFAVINELKGKTIISHAIDYDHAHPTSYWDGRYNLWRKGVPSMINPPYFTNTGYWIEAGEDQSIEENGELTLNGEVFYNDIINTSFPVKWEVVEGTGIATFDNENVINPTISFSESGTYVLKLTATDTGILSSEKLYHTVSDYITIEVVENTLPEDTTSPSCQLSFSGFTLNGDVIVNAFFDENVTGLDIDDFTLSNAEVLELTGSSANYSLILSPFSSGNLLVSLPEGVAIDEANNGNSASNELSVFIEPLIEEDTTPPTCQLSFSNFESNGTITLNVNFDEAVTGLEASDFGLQNSVVVSIIGSGSFYVLNIAPTQSGFIKVHLLTEAVMDNAGNGNTISNQITIFTSQGGVDVISPSCQISFSNYDLDGNLVFDIIFSESVTGLSTSDFALENAEIVSLTGNQAEYSLTLAPLDVGLLVLSLPTNSVVDEADNGNTISNQFTTNIEDLPNFPSDCNNVLTGGEVAGDENSCDPFDAALINNSIFPIGGTGDLIYQWQQAATLIDAWEDIPGANNASFDPPFLSETTFFRRLAKRENCEDYVGISNPIVKEITNSSNDIILDLPEGYCDMQGNDASQVFIENVNIEGLSYSSGSEGYADFTSESATLMPDGVYSLNLTPGNTTIDNKWIAWIDYNKDGDFNDDRELVLWRSGEETVSGFFQVPSFVTPGATKMRVVLRDDIHPSLCYSFDRGEVEDYTIVFPGEAVEGPEDENNSNNDPIVPSDLDYCEVLGDQPWWQWISKVKFSDLDHTSFKDKYGEFTDHVANVEIGSNYDLVLTPDFSWREELVYWKTWIDFNQDGDFDDPSELIVEANSTQEMIFAIDIPSNVSEGVTRMRVGMSRNPIEGPCENVILGEYEDYTINLQGGCGTGENRFGAILNLNANQYDREVELHWITNTEYKNTYFELEHSTNGFDFNLLLSEESANEGYLRNVYIGNHTSPNIGKNVYRIKQYYDDGTFDYSENKEVWFTIDLDAFVPYPNPTSQVLFLPLQKHSGRKAQVKIFNSFAQLVKSKTIESLSEEPDAINLERLLDGLYYITIEVEGERLIQRPFTVFRL